MNKEIIKAMNKENNKKNILTKILKWWNKNYYKIYRIVFFPLWILLLLIRCGISKYNKRANKQNVWSEKKANEILNYYIPRKAKWNEENNSFYFFDNGYGWSMRFAKKYLKRKDRRFWKMNKYHIRNYLIKDFELKGFEKKELNTSCGWTEIVFKLNEKNT